LVSALPSAGVHTSWFLKLVHATEPRTWVSNRDLADVCDPLEKPPTTALTRSSRPILVVSSKMKNDGHFLAVFTR
jgi:hypothetical protein